MNTQQEIDLLIRARYPILYIITWEEKRALDDLETLASKQGKALHVWSQSVGFTTKMEDESKQKIRDPQAVLEMIIKADDVALFVLKDFHPYMSEPGVIRLLRDASDALKTSYKTLIILSPILRIPPELEKDLTVLDYKLPDAADMKKLLNEMIEAVADNPRVKINLKPDEKEKLIQAALGLTAVEAENAFSRVLVSKGRLSEEDISDILAEKKQIVRKSGLLDYYEPEDEFHHVGGLKLLKNWLLKRGSAFSDDARTYGLPEPRGILLVGVQGCGKSLTAKAISNLWKLPLLRLDLGRLFSSLVGSSEENARRAMLVAESLAPCVLWIDEIEKGLSGLDSSSSSDAGTTSRVFGYFITWLQEKKRPVFVIATANEIDALPPELMRKGRFDEIFFVDLPNPKERYEIFKIHLDRFNRDHQTYDIPALTTASMNFSGAEIREAIIAAMYDAFAEQREFTSDDILRNLRETIPISRTMAEKIEELRSWAGVRARRANELVNESQAEKLEPIPSEPTA
ncbi:MAG TPA: AAA family ATPase [bacterium]|jgi:SpoVK/Ycf46/Vps4 family AAA+-type ATPase